MAEIAPILEDFVRQAPASELVAPRALEASTDVSSVTFRAMFASVARRLGGGATLPLESPPAAVDSARPHWTATEWLRAAMLAKGLAKVPEKRHAEIVQNLFEAGEIGEQESILRTLSIWPEPARFLETGLLGCRTNARRVFEAIACDNAYPERHFPELSFNQMVLKAIFIEVPVSRIEGLSGRNGPELARMATDYASERRAAGRPVPSDIDRILGRSTA
ncbi:MAG TPA: EboA domain-containing protein [Polyangiaceae bacterium]